MQSEIQHRASNGRATTIMTHPIRWILAQQNQAHVRACGPGAGSRLMPSASGLTPQVQYIVEREIANPWITLRGKPKSRPNPDGPILPNWQIIWSGLSGSASWKFFADASTVRPLKSRTKHSTSSFHTGLFVAKHMASWLSTGEDKEEARLS